MPATGLMQPQVQEPDLGEWVVVLKDHSLSVGCSRDLRQRGVTLMAQTSGRLGEMEVEGVDHLGKGSAYSH